MGGDFYPQSVSPLSRLIYAGLNSIFINEARINSKERIKPAILYSTQVFLRISRHLTMVQVNMRSKLYIFFTLILVGVFLRIGINVLIPDEIQERTVNDNSLAFKERQSNYSQNFLNDSCVKLEEKNAIHDKQESLSDDQIQYLKESIGSYCYCLTKQLQKFNEDLNITMQNQSSDVLKTLLNSKHGKKISDYCSQVAKFEVSRKAGRSIASVPEPPKKLAKVNSKNKKIQSKIQ